MVTVTQAINDTSLEDIFSHMKDTDKNAGVKEICESDDLIRQFGSCLLEKLGTLEERRRKDVDNIRTKLRTVGRLLKVLNAGMLDHRPLSDFLSGPNFHKVVTGVKELALQSDSPNIALILGHYLKQINLLKLSLGIRCSVKAKSLQMKDEANDFKLLYEAHWNSKVSCVANRRKRLRQINKEDVMPMTEDLVTLRTFLISEMKKVATKSDIVYSEWTYATQLLLVRICIFNKRRISEVEELKLSDYATRLTDQPNKEIMDSLSIAERTMVVRYAC